MTENTVRDTTINESSRTAGEVETLLFALERSRAQFAWKCGGLDAAGLNKPHPPSAMTLAGLLKHMALVEDRYTAVDVTGAAARGEGSGIQRLGPPWDTAAADADPDWEWQSAGDDSPEELYALWRGAVERSRAAWATAIADGGLDQPARLTVGARQAFADAGFDQVSHPSTRRVVMRIDFRAAGHVYRGMRTGSEHAREAP